MANADEEQEPKEDPEVTQIALRIADAKDLEIPGLLVRLKGMMEKHLENSDEIKLFKQTVWKYDLLSWCIIALQFDFTKIREGPEGAVSIVHILCKCSCTLNIDQFQEFSKTSLPQAIQNILKILRLLQRRIVDLPKKPIGQTKTDQELAKELFDDLKTFISVYRHLCTTLLNASDLLRIVMEGDTLTPYAINLIQTALVVNRFCLPSVGRGQLSALLDEFVYILTASSEHLLAASTTRLLVTMCEANDEVVNLMVNRFKGLRAILKKWTDHGFNRDLDRLILILQTGSAKKALLARQKRAAQTIWAFYTGWKTRKRVERVRRSIPSLQQSFRKQKREKEETAERKKSIRVQEQTKKLEQRRSFRKTREKQLHSLEIVPANKIPDFIQGEEYKAATKIQAHWRAHSERKRYSAKREIQRHVNAAITIQRAVRKFLLKTKRPSSPPLPQREPLGKAEKEKLEHEITRWQALHKRLGVTHDEALRSQEEAQKHLLDFYQSKYEHNPVRIEHKLNTLIATIHTEEQTLLHLPSLEEITPEFMEQIRSNSLAIRTAAEVEHYNQMKQISMPWWQKYEVTDAEERELEKL